MAIEMLNHNKKLSKAIHLLQSAANAKKDEISEGFSQMKNATEEAFETSSKKVKKAALKMNKSVHSNPWPYIGGTAVATLAAGFLLGFLRRK